MRSVTRLLLAAAATLVASGCFVGEEIDNASNMLGKDKSRQKPPAAGEAKPGAKPEAGTAVASAKQAGASVVATGKEWWAKATTLGSEEMSGDIAGCNIGGRTEFMLRDDCLARGGVPE
jgi:hypothetical protein